MKLNEKLKDNREKELWQAVEEQDVLNLRSQLRQIRNSENENLRSYSMIEMKGTK